MASIKFDTIAAIATPPGVGGIAIVRISGPQALAIIKKITPLKRLQKNSLRTTTIFEYQNTQKIDQVVVSYFKKPHSYTGQDTVEINCHGSIYTTNKILEEVIKSGARLAEPGEFTKRAFMAGKLDLTQVEAVAEMLAAKTDLAAQLALQHLEGDISKKIKSTRQDFLKLYAKIEASVDFPDEIAEPSKKLIHNTLKKQRFIIQQLLANADKGILIKEGLRIVLAGQTNVGKSSLFNYLLQHQKAIVTDIHGTTRDALEAEVNINSIKATLIDTAGFRRAKSRIETLGIAKSKEYFQSADLVLYLVDAQKGFSQKDKKIIETSTNKQLIFVINKSDLSPKTTIPGAIKISANTGKGISALKNKILKTMDLLNLDFSKHTYISSQRQKEKLIKVSRLATNMLTTKNLPLDILAVDLKNIITILGEITGDQVSEETISYIFENFCVGK